MRAGFSPRNPLRKFARRVDILRLVEQNTRVSRIAGLSAILALLFATIYAPFFHVHTHAGEAAVVHAHLPELESPEDESVVHMEQPHSHAAARSLDILTTTATAPIELVADLAIAAFAPMDGLPRCGFVAIAVPNAHAPPSALTYRIPRAPPA
jgi:hypothetical protein